MARGQGVAREQGRKAKGETLVAEQPRRQVHGDIELDSAPTDLDRRRNQITRVKLSPPAEPKLEGEAGTTPVTAPTADPNTVTVKVQPKKPGGGTTGAAA